MPAVLSGGFNCERLIAKRACFLARRLGRKAPQQRQQRRGGFLVGLAAGQHALDQGAAQLRRPTNCVSVSDSFATSASRIADGKSSIINIFSRIAGRWPCRSAMRLYEIG